VLAWHPYADVLRPLQLLGQAAVPTALLALGLSLGAGRGPNGQAPLSPRARVSPRVAVATLVGLKLVAQPVIAFLVGRYGFGLQGRVLLGSVVMSGLPTAQNVFVYASRYRQGVGLARSSVILSTVVAFLTLGVFTQLLG
jgi:predicted permease